MDKCIQFKKCWKSVNMWKNVICSILILVIVTKAEDIKLKKGWRIIGNPLAQFRPCKGNDDITVVFEPGLPPGEENQYSISIMESFPINSQVILKFDSEAVITLSDLPSSRVFAERNGEFDVRFFKPGRNLYFKVKGPATGTVPYVQSIVVNNVQYCKKPQTGYLDSFMLGYKNTAEVALSPPDESCGRRKVTHTGLIVNGLPTKPGDWPWHAAIYRLDGSSINYICGGTLLSKTLVLTVAHCTTIRGDPLVIDALTVVLGKFNLVGGDIAVQEKLIHEIIVHEEYDYRLLNNDISILKLKTEAVYDDYVQPACLWQTNAYKKLPHGQVLGTVVGWGFNQTDKLSPQLQQVTIPKLSEATCLKSNPLFFSRLLTAQKFCAGLGNGTSPCNGDSGGGFMILVPDISGDRSANATGAWYVRGIVSMTVARRDAPICDPNEYLLLTDIAKYKGWILKYLK